MGRRLLVQRLVWALVVVVLAKGVETVLLLFGGGCGAVRNCLRSPLRATYL